MLGLLTFQVGSKLSQWQKLEDTKPPFAVLEPQMLKILSLGHLRLYHDFSYFWLLQKLIQEKPQLADADKIFTQVKAVTRYQHDFESIYMSSCFILAFDYKRPDLCESIVKDGIKAVPDSWSLPAMMGYMSAFQLKDSSKAAYYYAKASSHPKCPAYIAKLSKSILNKDPKKLEQEDTIRAIIEGTEDADYRTFLQNHLPKRH